MNRAFRRLFAFGLSLSLCSHPAAASAPQPPIAVFGDYECAIANASGVSETAQAYVLGDISGGFIFSAYASRVAPPELQYPLRKLDETPGKKTGSINPEPARMFSASISPDIFAAGANALRSTDRVTYRQDGIVISFKSDLTFFAYGPAAAGGLAVYSGSCSAP